MKMYRVNEIADMFDVSQESVRRWVRTGELKGIYGKSRKDGLEIYESDLMVFVVNHKKYISRMAKYVDYEALELCSMYRDIDAYEHKKRMIDKEIDRLKAEIERLSKGKES